MDFERYLEVSAHQIDEEIEKILAEFLSQVKKTNIKLLPLVLGFINACKGGKRIRGTLVKLGYEIATGPADPRNDIVRIGAAYEILHAAILIHDDFIDKSPTRRGQPSLYKSIGISQAITLGDLGFFLAIKIISESNFPAEYKNQATKLFAETMVNTAIGQLLDIEKGDPIMTAKLKTAYYTISGPLQVGAILGGVPGKLIRQLGKFGERLGIAFQIKDDILDGELNKLEEAKKYIASAKKILPQLTKDVKMSTLFEQMAEYLVNRKK